MAQITIENDRQGVRVLNAEGTVLATLSMYEILDSSVVTTNDIIDYFPELHEDDGCITAQELDDQRADIVATITDYAAYDSDDEDGWVHHVDSNHSLPYKFCDDPACYIQSGINDAIKSIRGEW